MKRRIKAILIVVAVIIITYKVTFIRIGPPNPYLPNLVSFVFGEESRASSLCQEVYITRADELSGITSYIEKKHHVSYQEQMGRELLFSSDSKYVRVEFMPYLSKLQIWKLRVEKK